MRTPKTTTRTGGRHTVQYRNVDGFTMDAVVEGGTGTSLNLWVPHLPVANRHKTGIAKATGLKQTNVWFAR